MLFFEISKQVIRLLSGMMLAITRASLGPRLWPDRSRAVALHSSGIFNVALLTVSSLHEYKCFTAWSMPSNCLPTQFIFAPLHLCISYTICASADPCMMLLKLLPDKSNDSAHAISFKAAGGNSLVSPRFFKSSLRSDRLLGSASSATVASVL